MTEVTLNTENFIADGADYQRKSEEHTVEKLGEREYKRPTNTIIAFPQHIIANLKNYYEEQDCDSVEFEDEGELIDYSGCDSDPINALIKHILYAEKGRRNYEVTVAFTVEARTDEEAEQIVTDELSWGLDYNLISVIED